MTRAVLLFLGDYRDSLDQGLLGHWRAGTLVLAQEHETRGRSLLAGEIAGLDRDVLRTFYGGDDV
ncbi:hypothetical protein AA13595_2868 [Gluconacetobacter johannae DSM 13595]|nr:hypothetical protein AA13595_2868 [Gluconacetobacter johannae DSM 13595]